MNSNYVNIHDYCSNFRYLDNSDLIDVEDFWDKIYKNFYFLYFTKFYKGWYDCFESSKQNFLITKSIY